MMRTAERIAWDVRTADLGVVRRAIAARLKPFSLDALADGPYDARICHRRLIDTELTLIEYGDAAAVDAGQMGSFYAIQIPLRGSYWVHSNGERLRVGRGDVHVVHPRVHLRMECSAACRLLVLRTADARLPQLDAQLSHDERNAECGAVFSCVEGAGASLGRAVDYVVDEVTQGELLSAGSPAATTADSLLLCALLNALANRMPTAALSSTPYVTRAMDYILQHLDDEISLREVAHASRTSVRSLFRAFRAVHGEGPISWARVQRLGRVHAELADPAQLGRRISDIAAQWGFTHFGHFCAAYRRLHGETPSDTRRRAREQTTDH